MARRVYTPSRSRGYSNGRYWEERDPVKDGNFELTDICDECDALTLHKNGQCQICYTFKSNSPDKKK